MDCNIHDAYVVDRVQYQIYHCLVIDLPDNSYCLIDGWDWQLSFPKYAVAASEKEAREFLSFIRDSELARLSMIDPGKIEIQDSVDYLIPDRSK